MENYQWGRSERGGKRGKVVAAAALLAIIVAGVVGVKQVHQYFFADPINAESRSFRIEEGETFRSVTARLTAMEIIKSPFWFSLAAKLTGRDSAVKPGLTYVTVGDRYADLLGALTSPVDESEVSITIPEGFTLAQIGARVRAALPHITEEQWSQMTGPDSSLFTLDSFFDDAKTPKGVDLEGYLFPDTYRFFKNATVEDVVNEMFFTMRNRLGALGPATGDAASMSTHELLTLASIIEREVRDPEEMREVSDIFLKRLDIGMALQSDATVNYVTGGDDPSISLTDRDIDSPYNTYKYPGLPPGPISNPGLNALKAVWNPADNDYYYFLTDEKGTVYYARTNDEHALNKQKYLY